MLFHEVYGVYYHTVAQILRRAVEGSLREKELESIIRNYAFSESVFTILPALRNQEWQLLDEEYHTPIKHCPTMPLTILEKRWLKAIILDKRIRLFEVDTSGLEDVEPLFTPEDYRVFDQYGDGDPFENERYIEIFRTILQAIKSQESLQIQYEPDRRKSRSIVCVPLRLEYSEKDDKFRLYTFGCRYGRILNVGRMISCHKVPSQKKRNIRDWTPPRDQIELEVVDRRNALERVLFHFAHFERQAEKIADDRYRVIIEYDRDDETELVIRVLSFGPMVRVVGPERFVNLIRERLKQQKSCGL